MAITPTFDFEQEYWSGGITPLAGVDEVGMGALAGPVVAAAVILSPQTSLDGIRDSKTLTASRRERLTALIKTAAVAWAVGEASVAEITALNIRGAAHLAMARAVDQLQVVPALLLIDGTPAQPHARIPAVNLIDGDALCYSIAAASIIAKVHRDALMTALDAEYPVYGFAGHKGYGSAKHLTALTAHGATSHHRSTYAPVARILAQQSDPGHN